MSNLKAHSHISAGTMVVEGKKFYQAIIRNITARKRLEEALQISETRYRRLLESAQDGILILDADTGQIIDANPLMQDLLGYSYEEFVGKKLWDIGPFKDIAASKSSFDELQRKRYIRYEDLPIETSDGRLINVEFVSYVYMVDSKKVIQCNISDITERKRSATVLAEQLDELLRWREVTLGREGRILELKAEVNELLARAGQPPRYPSAESQDKKEK
jgi:PAS domain S-box-containing protein